MKTRILLLSLTCTFMLHMTNAQTDATTDKWIDQGAANIITQGGDTYAGNVGIGVSNPLSKLHVRTLSDRNFHVLPDGFGIFFNYTSNGVALLSSDNASVYGIRNMTYVSSLHRFVGGPVWTDAHLTVADGNNQNLSIGNDWINNNGMLLNAHTDNHSAHVGMSFAASKFYFHGGHVQIGTVNNPSPNVKYRLYVEDGILTERVKVAVSTDAVNWSDYVFEPDYHLLHLDSVQQFTQQNCHLPGMPSADEVYKEGIDMAEMDALLLKQIEELWLQLFLLKEENQELKKQLPVKN